MASSQNVEHDLTALFNEMWNEDKNCCRAYKDYEINLQSTARFHGTDKSSEKLFSWLDEDSVFARPTFQAFRALLDNYETELGKAEQVTREEIAENKTFLKLVMDTKVMNLARKFLKERQLVEDDDNGRMFEKLLHDLWFKMYRRTKGCRNMDSSGFEHVFVGEVRDGEVTGFHNWIQFYLMEKANQVNYRGYFDRGTPEEKEEMPHIITLQFNWQLKGHSSAEPETIKSKGSMFIGCSPEFELAVYTVCFLLSCQLNKGEFRVKIGGYRVEIICHRLGPWIGSVYPKCLEA